MPPASVSCRTICRSIPPAHCIKHLRRPRPVASCAASNSTTPRNTPAGSIWSSARSACCSANVSAAASTTLKGFEKRSQHGNGSEIKRETASNGCSQPTKPAPNSAAPIRLPPKSQNHCDQPLALSRDDDLLQRQFLQCLFIQRQPEPGPGRHRDRAIPDLEVAACRKRVLRDGIEAERELGGAKSPLRAHAGAKLRRGRRLELRGHREPAAIDLDAAGIRDRRNLARHGKPADLVELDAEYVDGARFGQRVGVLNG